jgi:uncharacterized membrane protein HdeD (DUF308 family)
MQLLKVTEKTMRDFWGLYLAEGICMLVLGSIALVVPPFAGLAFTILLGWLFLASSIFGLSTTLASRRAPGFWWSLLSAILTGTIGVALFAWPLGGIISLSLALGTFLLLDGFLAIGMALEHRRHFTSKWAWLLTNGIADILFAGIILLWLPQSAIWALGIVVGIDMLIGGATLVAIALDVRPQYIWPP